MNVVAEALCAVLAGRTQDVACAAWSSAQWELLAALGHDQGVLPLLAHAFDAAGGPAQIPSDVCHTIQAARYLHAAQNTLFYGELARIVKALASVSPVVVLKGAALGPTMYPNTALRPLSDIDLLVPETHLAAVSATLHALGYADAAQPQLAEGATGMTEHHLCLHGGPAQRVTVEVHWRLIGGAADWRSPEQAWFWQHTERRQASHATDQSQRACDMHADHVLHLTPTAHLLYLAAHLMLQHGGAQARLIWFYDLHLILTRCQLDWELLVKQAHAFRWTAALQAALQGVQQCFGTPLPAHVLAALDAATERDAASFVHQKAVAQPRSMRSTWLDLHALRWPTRVWWLHRAIWPSPRYMRWRYGQVPGIGWVWPLCYPYRWARALGAALAWLVRRRTGNTVRVLP